MRISDWDSDVCSSDLADIVLHGFGGGTAAKLGIDAERLMGLNSRLIYCDIPGYARDGPLGNQPGYDVMLPAVGGMLSTMRSEVRRVSKHIVSKCKSRWLPTHYTKNLIIKNSQI